MADRPLSSQVDVRARSWICPFCLSRNPYPPHQGHHRQRHPPSSTRPTPPSSTAVAPRAESLPIFLYVVDTCQEEDSPAALKESLVMSLSLLPENALAA